MSNEKPLHVLVAEALGWRAFPYMLLNVAWWEQACVPPGEYPHISTARPLPRYDTDWSATGPLLLEFRIGIDPAIKTSDPAQPGQNWVAREPVSKLFEIDSDPLVAACRLLLKLHAAGKLKG